MNEEKRADLLKDEYIMLQNFYEDIDSKGLTIKNWAITVALATIGTGVLYKKEMLIVGFFASLAFWYQEAYWRGLSYFFAVRIKDIESAFREKKWEEETPLQVYSTWTAKYNEEGAKTFKYLFTQTTILPHVLIAAICLLLYFLS